MRIDNPKIGKGKMIVGGVIFLLGILLINTNSSSSSLSPMVLFGFMLLAVGGTIWSIGRLQHWYWNRRYH
jgi:hypothetical protein